ncbi:DUF7452 domain-containing protein [Tenacibaculum sp. MEBiC06402]|uniref:DUF7452 domain-containing protein n=1 Tax=unclassified Tenacibaculum TaxID=2635139 RepID=UPI003B99D5F6
MKTYYDKKSLLHISFLTALLLSVTMIHAQTVFKHTVTKSNTNQHISRINHVSTNGKKDKILFVTHYYGKSGPYQTKAVGVWYNGKKWTVFNQDKTPIKANTKFNVLVANKSSNAFTVKAGLNAKSVVVNHPKLNKNPNAIFFVTQNWGSRGPYNTSPIGVYYSKTKGQWNIFNTDGKPLPKGAKFNVLVHSKAFKHRVNNSNKKGHITYINNAKTNSKNNALVFATFNSQTSIKRFNNPIGVWYSANKWTVYNENRSQLKGNEAYNILSLPSTNPVIPILKRNPLVIKTEKDPKKTDTKGLKNIGLVKYIPIRTSGSSSANSTEREGPNVTKIETRININTYLSGEGYDSYLDKLNISREIYRDQNKNSNIYYYLPEEYTLQWNKETGKYDFNIFYMDSDEGRGSVLVNAELTPQINSEDIKLAEKLLSSKLRKPVKLMPLDLRDVPKVDFGPILGSFNVSPESIHASIPTDYHKPIIIDWRMDSNVDNFVGAMLQNIGTSIKLQFKPHGDESSIIEVPVNLEVNSPLTFGKIEFSKTEDLLGGWTNNIDYPVVPKSITVLRKQGGRNYFKTIELENTEINTGETLYLSDEEKSELLATNNIVRFWIDYSLNTDCNPCDQNVKKKIIGGTSGSEITKVEVQFLNAITFSNAHSMKLLIKSIQADPNGIDEITFPAFSIKEDDQVIEDIQLFVPENKELSYNYQLITIMKDGEVKTSDWETSNSSLLVIGENQIKKLYKHKEKSELEKLKDSLLSGQKDGLIEKGKELLDELLGKKDKEKEETPKKEDE